MDSTSVKVLFNEKDYQAMIQSKTPFIGQGGYGVVYGPHRWKNKWCAVKRIMVGTEASKDIQKALKACEKWMKLEHKNIIPVYSVTLELPALYIVMEFGSGESLDKVLKKRAGPSSALPEEILTAWSIQVADGMAYLHLNNIVHRDLKSANIVVMEQDAATKPYGKTLKIADFDQIREHDHTRTLSEFGTCAWMAFEVIDNGKFSKKSDVYSYGVVLWEMLSRKVPHQNIKATAIIYKKQQQLLHLEIEGCWPATLKTIHQRCVLHERAARPSFAEILRVLQDKNDQLHSIWAVEGPKKEITSLDDLPLEMLDIILQKSYWHWIFNSLAKQKDEEAIRSLIAVDVCFNKRITRRWFKKTIWRYLKAYYHELHRKVAILKNNKSYITENTWTRDLIVQLRAADCLSDIKARLICRVPIKITKSKSSGSPKHNRSELLHAMRLFDDARLSTFIACLRQGGQKHLPRIAETGGVVVQASVVTWQERTKRSLQEYFGDHRHDYRDRSHEAYKLLSRLKAADIEVLKFTQDPKLVLWIWCKSQEGLNSLWNLYKSNELGDVLTAITHPTSSPEFHRSADISICKYDFDTKVAVRNLTIELTKRLAPNASVKGVTKLRNEIYVLYGSHKQLSPASAVIGAYQHETPFKLQQEFKIKECRLSCDIASCETANCLYISDLRTESIWKITITSRKDGQYEAIQLLACNYKPYTMSTSGNGDLLIIEESDLPVLARYAADGELLRTIQLPDVIKYPHHAVETSTGDFIIIDEPKDEENEDSSSGSEKKPVWRIHHVTGDGQMVVRSKELSSETQEVKYPWHLSLCSEDQVFMASSKVILLNSDFTLRATVDGRIPTTGSRRLFYDDEKRQLIVGGPGKGVDIYRLTMK